MSLWYYNLKTPQILLSTPLTVAHEVLCLEKQYWFWTGHLFGIFFPSKSVWAQPRRKRRSLLALLLLGIDLISRSTIRRYSEVKITAVKLFYKTFLCFKYNVCVSLSFPHRCARDVADMSIWFLSIHKSVCMVLIGLLQRTFNCSVRFWSYI